MRGKRYYHTCWIHLTQGVNYSLWLTIKQDALAVALSNIADKGIMVVVAQGNEGRDGKIAV